VAPRLQRFFEFQKEGQDVLLDFWNEARDLNSQNIIPTNYLTYIYLYCIVAIEGIYSFDILQRGLFDNKKKILKLVRTRDSTTPHLDRECVFWQLL
jgi:hypothetical protein